jgi:hypothetical protein
MKQQAIGVLAAAENTATKPIPASRPTGNGKNIESALPNVAPMKNNGVTSPPLKPKPKVIEVSRIFIKKSCVREGSSKDLTISGTPSPRYLVLCNIIKAITTNTPPITGLKGGYFMSLEKREM